MDLSGDINLYGSNLFNDGCFEHQELTDLTKEELITDYKFKRGDAGRFVRLIKTIEVTKQEKNENINIQLENTQKNIHLENTQKNIKVNQHFFKGSLR